MFQISFNPVVNKQAAVSAAFAALADPTRRQILERLSKGGECRVTALAKPFRMSLPAISKHLRVLEKARLICRKRAGREHLIRTNPEGLRDAQKWMMTCAEFWDARFDAIDEMLKKDQRKDKS